VPRALPEVGNILERHCITSRLTLSSERGVPSRGFGVREPRFLPPTARRTNAPGALLKRHPVPQPASTTRKRGRRHGCEPVVDGLLLSQQNRDVADPKNPPAIQLEG